MEPAHTIISRLGGASKVAEICGVQRSAPWKWTQPKEKGGTDGIIPKAHAPAIIEAGKQIGLDIPVSAFIPGILDVIPRDRKGRTQANA